MQVTVLGPHDKPLAGAKIHASVWTKEPFQANRDYVCNLQGKATVELPKTINILRLWVRKRGHVSLFANWDPAREAKPREFPDEYTFRLETGTTIGGIVKNDDDEPIAGAEVWVMLENPNMEKGLEEHPIPDIWLAEHDRTVDTRRTTNSQGRWTLDTAPAGDQFGFRVMLIHPDYVSDYSWGGLQSEQNVSSASLRERAATIVMHRGVRLSGIVTDPAGRPVRDAVVIWGDDPYLQVGSQEVRTDEKGWYQFPALSPRRLKVTVVAQGWAPDQKTIDLDHRTSTADFELEAGKTLRLRFVDAAGVAIPDVGVGIDRWRDGKALYNHKHPNVLDTKIPVVADADGIYEWTWAPDDGVTFNFYKDGYQSARGIKFTADADAEFEFTLTKAAPRGRGR
jgi:hypothetical protein